MSNVMSSKSFWTAVEQKLDRATPDELRAMVRAMASKVARWDRHGFVARMDERLEAEQASVPEVDGLLLDVRELADEVHEALDEFEPYEEPGYGDYLDEEEGLGECEALLEPLAELFDRVDAVFDQGDVALARAAYGGLFAIFEINNDFGVGISPYHLTGFDLQASRGRYLRAVYEDTPAPERVGVLYEELQRIGLRDYSVGLQAHGALPTLGDIVGASARPLPGLQAFLDEWIAYLREEGEGADADAWLREGVRMARGARGLEAMARAEGTAHPRAFVDWCAALAEEGDHRGVIAAAKVGLDSLPERAPIRAEIADHLNAAAAALGRHAKDQQLARWEALLAEPSLARLLDLRDIATGKAKRTRLMHDASQRLRAIGKERLPDRETGLLNDLSPMSVPEHVLAHGYLLAASWDDARELASRSPVLGWRFSNAQGLTIAYFLAGLSGKPMDALPLHLAELWISQLQANADYSMPFGGGARRSPVTLERLEDAYRESFAALWSHRAQLSDHVEWSLKSAERRIDAIVSGQHRRSYGKAASLLMACCEHLQARGESERAVRLLAEVRARFPRHRAFQAEVDTARARRLP